MKQPWEDAVWLSKKRKIYLASLDIVYLWIFLGIPLVFVVNSWLIDLFVETKSLTLSFFYVFGSMGMAHIGLFLSIKWFDWKKSTQGGVL